MRVRIARHQAERPSHWQTLEAPTQTGAAIANVPAADLVLLDCLTVLANNIIAPMPEPVDTEKAETALNAEIDALLAAYTAGTAEWIIVSNEVGLGIVPAYPLGRIYRDALGRANQRLAAMADQVLFMVAGLPLTVK
jgi:adenosylcobinamide kinase/adenosylcobinamide-phosphate guanylyltransferase